MTSKSYHTKQKLIYFKACHNLLQLENVINSIKEEDTSNFQISILGQVAQYYVDKEKDITEGVDVIKVYWKKVLGNKAVYGSFYNPEIGNVFIAGGLASTFLHKIDGKYLATMSSGPYGIFRGMGVSEARATTYLKILSDGKYLLIIRGFEKDLWAIEDILEEKV